ncbi:MAG: hypothetical protein MUD12_08575 [Spirochaetes bacterium]|jgi:hypothetical protein|nr:hypothetical protein [Spirochaetota bacterium]
MNKEIKLYDADSLEYCGSIIVKGSDWRYSDVNNPHLIKTTDGMPLKTVLMSLISFNLVYDIIPEN